MEALWKSCYDFHWYRERKDAPLGRVLLLFALAMAALTGARLAVLAPETDRLLTRGFEIFRKEVPPFKIAKGEVSIDGAQPWKRELEDGIGVIMIDTTGQTSALDPRYVSGLLLTKNQLTLRYAGGNEQVFDLRKVDAFDSKSPKVDAWFEDLRRAVTPFLCGLLLPATALGLSLRWLLTTLAAFVFARQMGTSLTWSELSRMAAFALIPAAYVILLGTLTPLRVMLLPTLVGLFFLGVAVWTARPIPDPDAPPPSDENI